MKADRRDREKFSQKVTEVTEKYLHHHIQKCQKSTPTGNANVCWDAVVDFCAFDKGDMEAVGPILKYTKNYVYISSDSVYV